MGNVTRTDEGIRYWHAMNVARWKWERSTTQSFRIEAHRLMGSALKRGGYTSQENGFACAITTEGFHRMGRYVAMRDAELARLGLLEEAERTYLREIRS